MSEGTAVALSGILAFLIAILQWRSQRKSELEARILEAKKPFLDRQFQLYTEATRTTAVLATTEDDDARRDAKKRFWELYWGELAMVENHDVEKAMEAFGAALRAGASAEVLARRSLAVAHACRVSLNSAWGIRAWTEGHRSPAPAEALAPASTPQDAQ
jgi:hypothetical protein